MSNFPPIAKYTREVQAVLEFLRSVVDREDAVYMSAPITSGRLVLESKRNGKYTSHQHDEEPILLEVIKKNRAQAKVVKQRIKQRLNCTIVDPTVVDDLQGWGQDDYRFLWAKVIEKYVRTIVCIDDWNYSKGCTYEFLVAKQLQLTVLNENLEPLSVDRGIILIEQAVTEFTNHLVSTKFLESVIEELKKIDSIEESTAHYESLSNRKH